MNVILRVRAAQALFAWHEHQHLIRLLELFSLLELLTCVLPRLHDYNRRTSDVAHSLDCIPRFRGAQEEVVLAFCKFATGAPTCWGERMLFDSCSSLSSSEDPVLCAAMVP